METKYIQLYNKVLKMIENRELKAGDKLPSEKKLMDSYNLSRDTVRKTLNMLVQDGYIEKARGKVAVVIDKNKLSFPISEIRSFKELHIDVDNRTYVENLEICKNEDEIMEELNLKKEEEYFKVIRIREIEGEKIIIDKDYIPRKFVPNISLKTAQDSLYRYFEEDLNLKISYCTKEITVQQATKEDRELLDMKNFDTIVVVKSLTYLEDGELFQYTESRHRPDKFKFTGYAYREKNIFGSKGIK